MRKHCITNLSDALKNTTTTTNTNTTQVVINIVVKFARRNFCQNSCFQIRFSFKKLYEFLHVYSSFLTVRGFRCCLINSSISSSVRESCSEKFGSSSSVPCSFPMSLKQFLLYASNSHDVDRQLWRHFGNVRTQFWRYFDSRSHVMAGKYPLDTTSWILPVGYRRICNGCPGL